MSLWHKNLLKVQIKIGIKGIEKDIIKIILLMSDYKYSFSRCYSMTISGHPLQFNKLIKWFLMIKKKRSCGSLLQTMNVFFFGLLTFLILE